MSKKQLLSISDITMGILKSDPPKLSVTVTGFASTSGWSDPELKPKEKTLSPDGILDLDFVATPPDGIALQVLTPVTASLIWEDDVDRLIGVKVYSRTEDQIQFLQQVMASATSGLTSLTPLPPGVGPIPLPRPWPPIPFPWPPRPWPPFPWPPRTTLAIGEENPPTFPLGEGGTGPFFRESDPRVEDIQSPFDGGLDTDFGFNNPFGRRG